MRHIAFLSVGLFIIISTSCIVSGAVDLPQELSGPFHYLLYAMWLAWSFLPVRYLKSLSRKKAIWCLQVIFIAGVWVVGGGYLAARFAVNELPYRFDVKEQVIPQVFGELAPKDPIKQMHEFLDAQKKRRSDQKPDPKRTPQSYGPDADAPSGLHL